MSVCNACHNKHTPSFKPCLFLQGFATNRFYFVPVCFLITSNSEWSSRLSFLFYITDIFLTTSVFEQHYQSSNQCSAETPGIQQILLNHITQRLLPTIWNKCLYLKKANIMYIMPMILHHMRKILLQIMNQKAKQQEKKKRKKKDNSKRDGEERRTWWKKWDRTRIKGNDVEKILTTLIGCQRISPKAPKQMKQKSKAI